jgi:hypothetical protein
VDIVCGLEPDMKLYKESNKEEDNVKLLYNDMSFTLEHGIGSKFYPGFLGALVIEDSKELPLKVLFNIRSSK